MLEERKERKVQRGPQLEEIGTEGDKCFYMAHKFERNAETDSNKI